MKIRKAKKIQKVKIAAVMPLTLQMEKNQCQKIPSGEFGSLYDLGIKPASIIRVKE